MKQPEGGAWYKSSGYLVLFSISILPTPLRNTSVNCPKFISYCMISDHSSLVIITRTSPAATQRNNHGIEASFCPGSWEYIDTQVIRNISVRPLKINTEAAQEIGLESKLLPGQVQKAAAKDAEKRLEEMTDVFVTGR